MLVLAGPGSGKTFVITSRTKYLIEECGVKPERILVITFTKAAAQEMRERFYKLMEGDTPKVTFGTFHAVYFTILKYAYGLRAENIIRDEQRIGYLKELIHKYNLEIEDENEYISDLTGEISRVKSEKIDLANYYSVNCSTDIFRRIFHEYKEKMKQARLIDFDDMLLMCNELLTKNEEVRKFWQSRYTYILIDEFQDINKVQYDSIRILAQPENNLFIVGDDDQSIYRFRGAKPEIMLGFEKDYPDAKRVILDYNYRSTQNIIKAAGLVIKNNDKRFKKNIKTIHEEGEQVRIRHFKTQKEEVETVIEEIAKERAEGRALEEIAVLFRTNTQPRLLAQKMVEYNIPFKMRDEVPNLYNHWIARNIFTYIRMSQGQIQRSDMLEVMNRPKRYISRDSLTEPTVDFEKLKAYYRDKSWMVERIDKLEYDLAMLKTMAPYAAIKYIQKGMEYEEYLKEYAQYRRISATELIDVIDEMAEAAKDYKTYQEWFEHIQGYTEEMKRQANKNKNMTNAVTFTTMHSSKGLEYESVYIIDANEAIVPHKKAVTEADIEEERRMFYVAMTRAKKRLAVYSVAERYNKEMSVSRFVNEMLYDVEQLKEGARVYHKKYKYGVIKKCDGDKLTIYFEESKRTFVFNREYCIGNHILTLQDS